MSNTMLASIGELLSLSPMGMGHAMWPILFKEIKVKIIINFIIQDL